MDRLICGDVGYGKTEIAVRAAFKAVQDGKQVAVLVPTTLLSAQHFATFSERYAPFPVTVRPMSRFQSDSEVAETLDGLAARQGRRGHRHPPAAVAGGPVRPARPADHRRGAAVRGRAQGVPQAAAHRGGRAGHVGHADPAHAGDGHLRDPGDVHDPDPARGAAPGADLGRRRTTRSRSRPRSGASCCATARCSSCTTGCPRSTRSRPGWPSWCRRPGSASGHGQMNEHTLEKVMSGFVEREFDVLVSTTIVESGLDIPNANTLIVDRADAYGLPDLHQLRGRVGPRPGARLRLLPVPAGEAADRDGARAAGHAAAAHRDRGAGMHIALKDLEIRGAGNLLGGEQSGHVAAVGFDLYVKMIGEAVRELRGDGPARARRGPDRAAGGRAHPARLRDRRAAAAGGLHPDRGDRQRRRHRGRAGGADRPVRVRSRPRWRTCWRWRGCAFLARQAGLTDITLQGNHIRFSPVELPDSRQVRVQRLYPRTVLKPAVRTMLVPVPKAVPGTRAGSGSTRAGTGQTVSLGAPPLRDTDLLAWCEELIETVLGEPAERSA